MESGTFGRTGWSSRCLTEGSPLQRFFRCLLRSPAVLNIAWHLLQLVVVGGDGVGFDVVDRHIIVGFEVFGLEVFRLVFFWHGVPGIVAFVPGISGLFVVVIFEIGLGVEGLVVGLFAVVHLVGGDVLGLVVLFWFVALGLLVVLVSIDWLPVIKLVVVVFVSELLDIVDALSSGACIELERLK